MPDRHTDCTKRPRNNIQSDKHQRKQVVVFSGTHATCPVPSLGVSDVNARTTTSNRGSLIALVLVLVTVLALSPAASPVFAQNDDAATPDGSVEVTTEPQPPEDETPPPTEEADPGDVETPTDVPVTEPAETPPVTIDDTETDATPPPSPDPTATPDLTPSLTYTIATPLTCALASGTGDGQIAAGGTLDYDCTFAIDLHGQNLTTDQIALAWNVSATTESMWSVRLSSATIDNGAWSDPGQTAQLVADSANLNPLAATADADGQGTRLDGRITLSFQMRLERPSCASDPVSFALSASATASTPGAPAATATLDGAQPDPLTIMPSLAPLVVSAPVVTIESVSIEPVAFSLDDRTTTGTMTIRVDTSTPQCSAHDIAISVQTFVGTDISDATSIISTGALSGAPDGAYIAILPEAGTPLAPSVVVSTIEAGATPGSYTQTISFKVAVPGQIVAGTFDVRASATVEERGP